MPSGEIVPHPNAELVRISEVPSLMDQIRPAWKARDLIARVERLLVADPSSACERIFNAAVHDLKEKVVIAGIDIAKQTAADHRLPAVNRAEDVEDYRTARLLDLCYRMGLLTRPEWRRLSRAYEIRRDLEHEDAEYEATIEDCIYIFKTSVEAVLSRDPIDLLRVTDVKEVIEAPSAVVPDARFLEDYERAPDPRQEEILRFLISVALDDKQPDLVRQNAYTVAQLISPHTRGSVAIAVAKHFLERVGRARLTELQVRVAHASGVLPYLRKAQRRQFFGDFYQQMEKVGYGWRNSAAHGELLRTFGEVGGLAAVPDELRKRYLKWMVLAYVGEPGGYGTFGRNRKVSDEHVARRYEELLDLVAEEMSVSGE